MGLKTGHGEERDQFGRFYAYYEETELVQHVRAAGLTPISITHDDIIGMSGAVEPCLHLTSQKP